MRVKNIGFWLVLFSIITLIFSPAIIYPFFQDDFFALVTTRIDSLADVWNLFRLAPEAVYWRPLGIQLYFGLVQFLGLGEPIQFHLISLSVHLLNTYLVYRLTIKISSQERMAKLTAFLWGTSPIHYFALGWAVNFSFILVVTWSILAILASKEGNTFRAILFLILGLMTNEMAVIIPGLVMLAAERKKFKLMILMSTVVVFYLTWRLKSGIKIQGDYEVGLTTALSTLRWYGLWILGWSDIVRDFIQWGVVFSSEFVKTFPAVVSIYLIEVAVLACYLLSRWRKFAVPKYFLWVIIGLMPILFFQKHLYSHYGAIAAIGFYWWLADTGVKQGRQLLLAVTWMMVAAATLGLNYKASWMADHAASSGKFQGVVRERMSEGRVSRIYIVSESSKAQTVLLGGYGVEYLTGIDRHKISFIDSEKNILGWTDDVMVIKL